MKADVFTVHHVHLQDNGEEDVKLIGIYSSQENAEGAVDRLKLQPGFRDAPEGFSINSARLDRDGWTEGYVTIYSSDTVGPE